MTRAALTLAVIACGGGDRAIVAPLTNRAPSPCGSGMEVCATPIGAFADRGCACTDRACATAVADSFAVWLDANKNARGDEDAAARDAERLLQCLTERDADLTKLMRTAEPAGR
jgi:hypothetical protein